MALVIALTATSMPILNAQDNSSEITTQKKEVVQVAPYASKTVPNAQWYKKLFAATLFAGIVTGVIFSLLKKVCDLEYRLEDCDLEYRLEDLNWRLKKTEHEVIVLNKDLEMCKKNIANAFTELIAELIKRKTSQSDFA